MRTRSLGLSLFAGLAVIVSACGGGGATTAPTSAATAAASEAASQAPASQGPTSKLRIGVVTDIGTLNDKNFNEYSFKGAEDGAKAIGAPEPHSLVPADQTAYAADINSFVALKTDIIVTVGFNLTAATVQAAHDNPDLWFIGVDQSPICVTKDGLPDPNFKCEGDAKTLLPHYISLQFQEDQAGYLAGIVAASVDTKGEVSAIGGTTLCAPCVRYIQGYELGAKSVKSDIVVSTAYVTNDFSAAAFQDQAGGKVFAENFLAQHPNSDVMFQVAGLTGNGVLDAACAANIHGIGVDVDQFLSYPAADACLVTSAEKHLEVAVGAAIQAIAANSATPGDNLYNAKNDGIGISDFHDKASLITADTQAKIDAALAAMKAGTLVTCPADSCGVYKAP
ncbi:MAG TPA: BMP family ABC transporter substrate-binding protein [Candidatus Limnocylindrales bacterium]